MHMLSVLPMQYKRERHRVVLTKKISIFVVMSARLLTKPLVDAAWLIPRIGESHLRILDCSLYLPAMGRDAKAEFGASRIPGATFFDIDAASDPDAAFPHTLNLNLMWFH